MWGESGTCDNTALFIFVSTQTMCLCWCSERPSDIACVYNYIPVNTSCHNLTELPHVAIGYRVF